MQQGGYEYMEQVLGVRVWDSSRLLQIISAGYLGARKFGMIHSLALCFSFVVSDSSKPGIQIVSST